MLNYLSLFQFLLYNIRWAYLLSVKERNTSLSKLNDSHIDVSILCAGKTEREIKGTHIKMYFDARGLAYARDMDRSSRNYDLDEKQSVLTYILKGTYCNSEGVK